MVFSDTATKQGIVQDIDFTVNSDSITYPIEQKTRNINRAMDKAVSLILSSDGVWEWDDSNQTDLPTATTDLVSGQNDYSFAIQHLKIINVLAKNSGGDWQILKPFDLAEDKASEYLLNPDETGSPRYYDKRAGSVFLFPKPDYASTGGLKINFQRPSTYFTTSDTTKAPGFATIFHKYISLLASYDYAMAKGLPKINQIKQDIAEMELAIQAFYGKRNDRDDRTGLRAKVRNYE